MNFDQLRQDVSLHLDSAVIQPSETIRDLGVQLDSQITMYNPIVCMYVCMYVVHI